MMSKFGLYDFIAVVVPGVFFLWALGTFVGGAQLQAAVPLNGGLGETSVLLVVGYVTGLLLQGVSQQITERILLSMWGGFPSARWLLPSDKRFSSRYHGELASALQSRLGINMESEALDSLTRKRALARCQEIFYRCYRNVERCSELPQTFNAQYGLFRALLTTFIILAVIVTVQIAIASCRTGCIDGPRLLFATACILASIISYWRVRKRADDFAKAVYDVFLSTPSSRT